METVNAKRLNQAVEILNDFYNVYDKKDYTLLSEIEKSLIFNATILLEKVVVRMQNHGDKSLTK